MFTRFKSQKSDQYVSVQQDDDYIIEQNVLRTIYKTRLLPLEEHYLFNEFHMPKLEDADFVTTPIVMISGDIFAKRRFVRQITEVDLLTIQNTFEQPFNECFNAIMFAEEESVVSGNTLVFDPTKPFRPLTQFGLNLVNHFQGIAIPSPTLKTMVVVDTPNVLKKESTDSSTSDDDYDLTSSFDWFCQRADRILLFFDAHNLKISDIDKRLIESHPQKIVVVLDNSDMNQQKLMRVYASLMYTLAKIVKSSDELARVFVGPLCNHYLHYPVNGRLFRDERQDFLKDLKSVATSAAYRQLSQFLERARLAKVHAYIVGELHKEFKSVWRKERKKLELCKNLQSIFDKVKRDQNVSADDFPDVKKMQIALQDHDFSKFNSLKPQLVELFDDRVVYNVTQYMNKLAVVD